MIFISNNLKSHCDFPLPIVHIQDTLSQEIGRSYISNVCGIESDDAVCHKIFEVSGGSKLLLHHAAIALKYISDKNIVSEVSSLLCCL